MTNLFSEQVVKILERKLNFPKKLIPLHEPSFSNKEYKYLKECIDSTFVSSVGKFVDLFESKMVKFTGAKYSIAVVNGTAAIHAGLKIIGVKNGSEVLTPSLTFAGATNAITYCQAIPHFIDSEQVTLGVDPKKLRKYLEKITIFRNKKCINKTTGKSIDAMIITHLYGHPCNMQELLRVSKDFNVPILEDAAEAIGSYYKKKHVGTFGQVGVVSFNGNKPITTGGGGIILTNSQKIANEARHLTTTAKIPHLWEHRYKEIGYNYRMPNINAALGLAQLENLPKILKNKRDIFREYDKEFKKIDGVYLKKEPKNCKSNYWLNTLILNKHKKKQRLDILRKSNQRNIMTRACWTPMHRLPHFKKFPKMNLDIADQIYETAINIPSSSNLLKIFK